ncbi:MAG TPA: hypothetical protein VEH62_10595 [Gemmatimonadales bacterium]|nr:hypothetical protein [Gemmatimonadales bacterium]
MSPTLEADRSAGRAVALADEERLVQELRAALPVEAQTMFFRRFDELLALLAEPRCAECQADGVPCPHVAVSCEQCGRSVAWVRDLRDAIARSST